MNWLVNWLLGFATDYQVWATFVAAAVGFGGVILTLEGQHRSNLEIDEKATRRAAKRLATLLRADLEFMKSYAQEIAKEFDDPNYMNGFDTVAFPRALPFVGDALITKFDLLGRSAIPPVLTCYLFAKDVPIRLGLLADGPQNDPQYIKIPKVAASLVADLFRVLEGHADKSSCGPFGPGRP